MVAELKPQANDMTRATVVARVQVLIDDGASPNAAFAQVYEAIEQAGELEALARLYGSTLVGMLWRGWNLENRPAAVTRSIRKPVPPTRIEAFGQVVAEAPGRVVNPEMLRETSMLDAQYKLNGEWVRLRNMDKTLCHKAFEQYRSAAVADEHNAQYFRALEAALKENEKVADRFDEAQLIRLFKIAKPVSRQIEAS